MNKKRIVFMLALMMSIMSFVAINAPETNAFGKFLKNKMQGKATQEATQEATKATDNNADQNSDQPAANSLNSTPTSSEPQTFENNKYHFAFTYPGNWELKNDDPKKSTVSVTDMGGQNGYIHCSCYMDE